MIASVTVVLILTAVVIATLFGVGIPRRITHWRRFKKQPEELIPLLKSIERFQFNMRYYEERPYQTELYGWLKQEFKSNIEMQTDFYRPDIVADNVAIEVKGPSDEESLKSAAGQCMMYLRQFPYVIIVLCAPIYNPKYFAQWKEQMNLYFPKVTIVEKHIQRS